MKSTLYSEFRLRLFTFLFFMIVSFLVLASASNFLTGLSIDQAPMRFQPSVHSYSVSVPNEISFIRVYATPVEGTTTHIMCNDKEYERKDQIPINVGENLIHIISLEGKYEINLERKKTRNIVFPQCLTSILVDGFPIQGFRSNIYKYEVLVPNHKSSIIIDAIPIDTSLTVTIKTEYEQLELNSKLYLPKTENTFMITLSHDIVYKVVVKHVDYANQIFRTSMNRRLTPQPKNDEAPKINCPRIFGARPSNPFFFSIATDGAEPITYTCENLPPSLSLNSETGIITGTTPEKGTYEVKVKAVNANGADQITLKIVSGDKIALTPPMGWNSWYVHSEAISSENLKEMVDYLRENKLHKQGFTYMNIDDCWQGKREPTAPYRPTGKKPFKKDGVQYGGLLDMPELTNYVHSFGLKAGIYSGPKASTYAGFLGSSSNEEDGMEESIFSPFNKNSNAKGPKYNDQGEGNGTDGNPGVFQPTQFFGRWFSGYESSPGAVKGKYWFGTIDTQTWSDWGFDYVKWDWALSNDSDYTKEQTKQCHDDIIASKRDIVLSLSNTIGNHKNLQNVKEEGANSVRIAGDIQDSFFSVLGEGIEGIKNCDLVEQGFWNDLDMLQIGYLGKPNGLNVEYHKTHLSKTEQYYQVSLWSVLQAPLLLSCHLKEMDDFTIGLLTNQEVLRVNQDELSSPTKVIEYDTARIIVRKLADGRVAVGVFVTDIIFGKTVEVLFDAVTEQTGVSFPNGATVRNLWDQKDVGVYHASFTVDLEAHQGLLFTFTPIE